MATQVKPSKNRLPADQKIRPSADSEQPEDYKQTFRSRSAVTKYSDPCEAASKASLQCMERAHYNRNECMDYFKSYRECKKRWMDQRNQDRRDGKPTS